MFTKFFFDLKGFGVPVSLKEFLSFLEGLECNLANYDVDQFYYLSRACLVKDEKHFDKFDRVFGLNFSGKELEEFLNEIEIPDEWLKTLAEKVMTPEEMASIAAIGDWERLMDLLQKRFDEQEKRHEGGSKMIGTAGTSPFGAYGYNPEGVRIGQSKSRHQNAVKVWDERRYQNLDDTIGLGARNIKIALRRLRKFAREGAEDELDLSGTIRSTAENGGFLDIRMIPEKHNSVKVLLLLDIGGSMDVHINNCQQLFSAARSEFKNLEYYYFHNCLYERVWKDNRRRKSNILDTNDLINKYSSDYKLVFVGDANMSPYEIIYPGGSVEHWNEESGASWMERIIYAYPDAVWLNPIDEAQWGGAPSNKLIQKLMTGRMYPLNLNGLDRAMRKLGR